MGPFWIDTTPPTLTALDSSVPQNAWFDGAAIHFDWTADDGGGSGAAGFAVRWTQVTTDPVDPNELIPDPSIQFTNVAAGDWYFRIAPVDAVLNVGAVQTLGPFRADLVAPEARFVELDFDRTLAPGEGLGLEWEVSDDQSGVQTVALLYSFDGETWETYLDEPYAQIGDVIEMETPASPTGQMWLRLDVTDAAGNTTTVLTERAFDVEVAVDAPTLAARPERARLAANTPNPFNPRTTIHYGLARSGPVRVRVHDVAGRRVRTLVDDSLSAGWHQVVWDGQDDAGRSVASGRYFVRVDAGDEHDTRGITLVK